MKPPTDVYYCKSRKQAECFKRFLEEHQKIAAKLVKLPNDSPFVLMTALAYISKVHICHGTHINVHLPKMSLDQYVVTNEVVQMCWIAFCTGFDHGATGKHSSSEN